jgi:hypothetical protein
MPEAAKRGRSRQAAAPAEEAGGGHVCTVSFCPICLAVTTVQPLKPEAVEHLLNAGREFLLAMTAVLGARADATSREEPAATLTRIDIE